MLLSTYYIGPKVKGFFDLFGISQTNSYYIIIKENDQSCLMKALKKYLNKYGFVSIKLSDIPLQSFQYFFQTLFTELEIRHSLLFPTTQSRLQKIDKILQVLSEPYSSTALCLMIKQLATIFMLSRKYISKGIIQQQLCIFLQATVRRIMEQDTRSLVQTKEKKPGSLEKIYQFIRELSGSKDKYRDGRTKIEVSSQKGVKGGLKETIKKVIVPFCGYLLRILQDCEAYSLIFGKKETEVSTETRWKLINLALLLGDIVYQLSKLSRYFSSDFQQIHVFMVSLCTKDLAPLYDLIKESIEQQSIKLASNISRNSYKSNKTGLQEQSGVRLNDLKRVIEQMYTIKDKLNSVFGNKRLTNFVTFFKKPTKYRLFQEVFLKQMEVIANFNDLEFNIEEQDKQIYQKKQVRTTYEDQIITQKFGIVDQPTQTSFEVKQIQDQFIKKIQQNLKQEVQKSRINKMMQRIESSQKACGLRRDKRIQLVQ